MDADPILGESRELGRHLLRPGLVLRGGPHVAPVRAPPRPVQGLGSSATTARTPGSASALAPSYRFSMPPNTGHRSIDAISISGTVTSIPNTALPSTLAGVSSRGARVPSRRKSLGSLSGASLGTGTWAARAASLP